MPVLMTELAAVRTNSWGLAERIEPAAPAAPSLAEWVEQAQQVATIADMLCRTSFVPKAFVGKAPECAAAILAGQEMGMSPMASLRAIDVIEGKPAMSAVGLRALVQSKGHEIWTQDSTATRAVVKGRRRGSDKVETSTWTIDRAKTFGLTGKKNWREQPTAMLLARATSECARLIAADALLGMPYSAEELADGADIPDVIAEPTAPEPKRRSARRTARPAPPAVPEPDEPAAVVVDAAPDEPEAEPITKAQLTKLHTLLTRAGITDRDEGLAYYAQVIGRDVASSKDLTKAEASKVIDRLEVPPEPPANMDTDEPDFDDDWPEPARQGGTQ